jgi:hypothetical protein
VSRGACHGRACGAVRPARALVNAALHEFDAVGDQLGETRCSVRLLRGCSWKGAEHQAVALVSHVDR